MQNKTNAVGVASSRSRSPGDVPNRMTHVAAATMHYVDKGVCAQAVCACIEELLCMCMYDMYGSVCYYVCIHDVLRVHVCPTQHIFMYVCMCTYVCYVEEEQ